MTASIIIEEPGCHDECREVVVFSERNTGSVEFNVSDVTNFRYVDCNICCSNIACSTYANSGFVSDDWTHPTIEDAILHAWSHVNDNNKE